MTTSSFLNMAVYRISRKLKNNVKFMAINAINSLLFVLTTRYNESRPLFSVRRAFQKGSASKP